MSSADLSRKLFVTPSNITGIIDRLEKKGLVERVRKETDRRVSLITLTPSGADVSGMLPDPIEKKLISRLAHLDTRKVERLQEAMEEILAMVGGEDLSDSPIEIAQEPGGEDRH
jgi:DNA-binding MarR family transcriptional regulator